ncbi:MAG TPA: 3-phosphoshikimate 1-carboxyvinyltransferase [Candidatus Limnocylindrales bacterium]|nr:3-phosphoshikimate 1-carboxyvinyltransferase [Candidatus Limnocylindrales bacterium]
MKSEIIQPVKALSGGIELPGDKSISHRYAMLAALAGGTSELRNFAAARDCHSTLGCIKSLGADISVNGATVKITGHGLRGLKSSWRTLDAENSGTTIRLLSGILSGQSFTSKITGDASLQKRPMKRVITPLREMGADIRGRDDNFPPLEIRGGKLHAIHYQMPMASAQVKSAVLLAGLFADGETSVTEPAAARDHTELALEEFGAPVRKSGRTITVQGLTVGNGNPALRPISADVPGDLSSAVFFIAAASLFAESNLYLGNVGLNPTRSAILDFFKQMGAGISVVNLQSKQGELVGDLSVKGAQLKGGLISGNLVPLLIDELPMLAALGPYTEQGIELRDAAELRVKESDRIAALAENLKRMGAKVEERPGGLHVEGRSGGPLHGAEIDPRGDHRIAMAFAVAGLAAQGETRILDSDCAGVSYPAFFSELRRLAGG